MEYTLKVMLFTDVDKKNPDKDTEAEHNLDEESKNKYKKYLSKKYPNPRRFWAGTLNVSHVRAQFFNAVREVLQVRHVKNKDWKPLYEV